MFRSADSVYYQIGADTGCPNGTTLRILGTNPTTYLVLAYYWDNVAPHASSFTQTANGDDGSSFWVELTYTGGAAIPEPAGLGLIGAALLMLRRRRS